MAKPVSNFSLKLGHAWRKNRCTSTNSFRVCMRRSKLPQIIISLKKAYKRFNELSSFHLVLFCKVFSMPCVTDWEDVSQMRLLSARNNGPIVHWRSNNPHKFICCFYWLPLTRPIDDRHSYPSLPLYPTPGSSININTSRLWLHIDLTPGRIEK